MATRQASRNYRPKGVSGAAGLLAIAGLYLVYVGVKDVPVIGGLRLIASGKSPANLSTPNPSFSFRSTAVAGATGGAVGGVSGDAGIERLVGNAKAAYPMLKRKFPSLRIGGWRATSSTPNSDHPLGKAMDVFTTDNATAQQIITLFRSQTGAKYWIWNRQIAHYQSLWVPRPYSGASPHTDHVHLSYY